MKKGILLAMFLAVAAYAADIEEVRIESSRGWYVLDFRKTYVTYMTQDIETSITLPAGYTFLRFMPGSRDYISAGFLQNVMYVSCPVNEQVMTNLTMHVQTPEGLIEQLVFRFESKKNAPKILAIHFERANNSELNRTIEAVKARYQDQMSATLADQEQKLNAAIHDTTMVYQRVWFVKNSRGKPRKEFKGAKVFFDGMANSRSDTYVYLTSEIENGSCNIVNLNSVSLGKKDKKEAEFVHSYMVNPGQFVYVYRIPQISIPKKAVKAKLNISIWSKNFTLNVKGN